MFHGSAPNNSSNNRMAQFIKAFPRSKVNLDRLVRRAKGILREMRLRLDDESMQKILCDKLACSVFGLDALDVTG